MRDKSSQIASSAIRQWQQARSARPAAQVAPASRWQLTRSGTAAAHDSDELCRLLVQSPWGWGSSTRHGEAVSLLRGLGSGTLPGSLVALLLCTCRRWSRVPMAWRCVIVTRCCMACSMPRTGWMRTSAASWWAGPYTAESPGSAGPLSTGCVNSTGRKRRCATHGRTLIGRCALGARPARLHRRRRSCRALHHRSREGTRSCAGWLS